MDKKIPHAVGQYLMVRHIPGRQQEEEKTQSGIIIAKEERERDGDVVYMARGS